MSDDQYWKERTREALAQIKENVERIAELEAALKPFAELGDNFSDSEVMESIRHARKVLGEK
jgi:C4-dicarboxylate-specific signal transduction histidine kinase